MGLRLQEFKAVHVIQSLVPAQGILLQDLCRPWEEGLKEALPGIVLWGSSDWAARLGAHLHPPHLTTLCQGAWPTHLQMGPQVRRQFFLMGSL